MGFYKFNILEFSWRDWKTPRDSIRLPPKCGNTHHCYISPFGTFIHSSLLWRQNIAIHWNI